MIAEVDFVFCCSCFVSDIFYLRFMRYENFFEITHFIHRRHSRLEFDFDNFEMDGSMLITCFDHLKEAMYSDAKNCLHYYKRTFYQTVLKRNAFRVIGKTLRNFKVFSLIWCMRWKLTLSDLARMQSAQQEPCPTWFWYLFCRRCHYSDFQCQDHTN